jgi:hypothetical protein
MPENANRPDKGSLLTLQVQVDVEQEVLVAGERDSGVFHRGDYSCLSCCSYSEVKGGIKCGAEGRHGTTTCERRGGGGAGEWEREME